LLIADAAVAGGVGDPDRPSLGDGELGQLAFSPSSLGSLRCQGFAVGHPSVICAWLGASGLRPAA